MLNVIRSEAIRISQRRTLLIWFGLMAGFAVMVNTVMGSALSASTGGLPTPGVSLPTREELETSSGIVAGLWSASNMFGVVTLSLWAFFTAQDYSSGLIRLLVASEPNRLRLLAGKAITLAGFTALAVTVAVIANVVAAPAIGASGISTAAWGQDLSAVLGKAWINLYLSQLVWGMLGLVIAVVSRSAMTAVSLGVGYVLTVESIVRMIDGAPVDQLLGTTLGAIAKGGTEAVSYQMAATLGLGYGLIGFIIAGLIFVRRDVTD
jgi:ABC-type transport system involved in multi-copper enzyme maturation permease subunit